MAAEQRLCPMLLDVKTGSQDKECKWPLEIENEKERELIYSLQKECRPANT